MKIVLRQTSPTGARVELQNATGQTFGLFTGKIVDARLYLFQLQAFTGFEIEIHEIFEVEISFTMGATEQVD